MIKKETVLNIIDNYTCAENPEDPYPSYGTIAGMFDVLSILKEEISKLPDEDNWIPVEEKLPDINKNVLMLIKTDDGGFVCQGYRVEHDILNSDLKFPSWEIGDNAPVGFGFKYNCNVYAWKPLPEPYKGE